jgi:hypothetical protein
MRKSYVLHAVGLFCVGWELVICVSQPDKLPWIVLFLRDNLQ